MNNEERTNNLTNTITKQGLNNKEIVTIKELLLRANREQIKTLLSQTQEKQGIKEYNGYNTCSCNGEIQSTDTPEHLMKEGIEYQECVDCGKKYKVTTEWYISELPQNEYEKESK